MKPFNVLLLLVLAMPALARQSASISGTVRDQRSNPVPDATVYVLNTGRAAITDSNGSFTITGLPAGKYTIRITAVGFAALSREVSTGETGASFSLAQSANQLDAVLVSAQKKDEWLERVPLSVSVLSSTQINNFRLWNPKQLTAIVPNLYSADPGDGRNVTSIRGITSTSYDPAVVTYIDGVNQFGLDTYIPQLFDVERIEVLRGPQGTLYGRNAMGGVINIITRQPTNQANAFGEISLGNYGQQRYGVGLRSPIVNDKLFVGMAMVYEKRKGFYENEYYDEDFDKQHSANGNYYIKYLPAARWSVLLNFKHQNARNNGTFPLVQGVTEALQDPFKLSQNAKTEMIDNSINGSFSVNHAGRGFNFSSQTAYQSNHRHYTLPIDGDFSPLDAVTIINNYGKDWNTVKVWTQEFRVSSPAAIKSPVSWTAGTYLFQQKNPVKQTTAFGSDADLIGVGDENFSIINTSRGKSTGIALFGQITWAVTAKTEITAGLRYDHENKEQSVKSEYQHDPDPNPQFNIIPDTSAEASFEAFTPKISIAHNFSANQQLYITYNRGYRTGGFTQLSSDPSQPPLYAYKPEYSNNFELGYKNQFFGNHVRIHLSAFYSTVNDAQVPTLVLPDAITVTRNAGKLESKGAEAEASIVWAPGVETSWAFGYTDAKYKTLKVSAGGAEVDLAGNRQIYTPKVTSLVTTQYTVYFNERRQSGVLFRAEWQHMGEQFFDLANNIRQSPYSIYHARVGVTSRHLDVMGWARNIGNRKYIAYAYDFGAVHLGNPSTIGVTVMWKL
jgi:iron complex outermembrane recepter protein